MAGWLVALGGQYCLVLVIPVNGGLMAGYNSALLPGEGASALIGLEVLTSF